MTDERMKQEIDNGRTNLKNKIDLVCRCIDRLSADSYQLFQSDGYKGKSYRATQALNARLKKLVRQVPTWKVIHPSDIATIIHQGMLSVREKHAECGADESEVTWIIEDVIEKLLKE